MVFHPRSLLIGLGAVVIALAVTTMSAQHQHQAAASSAPADQQAMMARMEASQQVLDDLLEKMNAAAGPERIDHMAAILNELVAQQRRMHAHMMAMHGGSAAAPAADAPASATEPKAPAPASGHVHE